MEQRWKISAAENPTTSTNIKNKLNIQLITHIKHFVRHTDKLVNTVRENKSYLFANCTKSMNIFCGKMHIAIVLKQVVHIVTTVP